MYIGMSGLSINKVMKILKSIFGKTETTSGPDTEAEYDKHAGFYYTNLVNAITLFSLTWDELDRLGGPAFDPVFELESEIDYAFTPVCFETIFRNGLVDVIFKNDLLLFKRETDNIPKEIWTEEHIAGHETWALIRQKANALLHRLNINTRTYNDKYITVYDAHGKRIDHP